MYRRTRSRVSPALFVGLFLAVSLSAVVVAQYAASPAAASSPGNPAPAQAGSPTLSYRYHDFFNVPYGEWWDYRFTKYGDLAMNAECFNATSIVDIVCRPSNASVPDYITYPFTNWYPLPGNLAPGAVDNNPMIYAPYRFDVAASYIPGYNVSQPVFLPVFNYAAAPSGSLTFDWRMQYLDRAAARASDNRGCPRLVNQNDGFLAQSFVTLTMDLQESKRLFKVQANTPAEAQSWWNANIDITCAGHGPVEAAIDSWFYDLGNLKYDVVNSFEYPYTTFFTIVTASVDPGTGRTTVNIEHVAWGTEVLLARWFYWGNTSYSANYLDSTKRRGWWGMELSWFEDFRFQGSLTNGWTNFTLSSVMQYHFQLNALPGPNGIYDRTDDVPYWTWGPVLSDYTNDFTPTHLLSELDRYPDPPYSYVHSTPGSPSTYYGQAKEYDYVPITWDLAAGESWDFQFPTGNVPFFDPNLTPLGANPRRAQFVLVSRALLLGSTTPSGYGTWDAAARRWTVTGPTSTGGLPGSPGADRLPGTPDDQYPLGGAGGIAFIPAPPIAATLTSPWSQLYPTQSMSLTVSARVGGVALPGATVGLAASAGGVLGASAGVTDANGAFSTTLAADAAAGGTTVTVSLTVSKVAYTSGTAQASIAVVVEGVQTTATVTSLRAEMMGYETAVVDILLQETATLNPVNGALITMTSSRGGNISAPQALGGGRYQVRWDAPRLTLQTFVSLSVRARTGGFLDATGRIVILVDPNMTNYNDPTPLFLLSIPGRSELRPGESVVITVYAYVQQGYVVSGGTMTATVSATLGTVTRPVDQLNGVYTFTYTAATTISQPTGVLINVAVSKVGYQRATTRVGLIVTP